jgi:hypothetical protein
VHICFDEHTPNHFVGGGWVSAEVRRFLDDGIRCFDRKEGGEVLRELQGFLCVAVKCFKGLCCILSLVIPLLVKTLKHVSVHPLLGALERGYMARGASGGIAPHVVGSVSSAPNVSSSSPSCTPASSVSPFSSGSSSSSSAFGSAGYCGVGDGVGHSLRRLLGALQVLIPSLLVVKKHMFWSDSSYSG